MKYYRKTNQTNNNIKNSFIQLLETQSINNVSVNQIIAAAQITRGTFYRYYSDKYDLLNQIENDMIEILKQSKDDKKEKTLSFHDHDSIQFLNTVEQNSALIQILLSKNAQPANFLKKLKKIIEKTLNKYPELSTTDQEESKIIQKFIFAFIIQSIQEVINPKRQMSIKELSFLLEKIFRNGLYQTIQQINS